MPQSNDLLAAATRMLAEVRSTFGLVTPQGCDFCDERSGSEGHVEHRPECAYRQLREAVSRVAEEDRT